MPDLIITAVTPNVKTGRGVRTYGVTAALAHGGPVEVAYAVFDWPEPSPEYESLPGVTFRALRVSRGALRIAEYARARLRRVPDGFARGASPELRQAANRAGAQDRVIADGPTVAAALLPLARRRPVIYLAHNLESGFRPDPAGSLKRFESELVRTFSETWMATHADERGAVELAGRDVATRYVPNVVDVAAIEPVAPSGRGRILFVGDFTYPPNREALAFVSDEVLPRVWERRPEVRLGVVGRGLEPGDRDARIEVLGFVDDLRGAYAEADAVVVPLLHGGGSPLKFVEALAYGLPVIATDHAAGLIEEGTSGRDFLSADGAGAFAGALEQVLGDPALARKLGAAGRALAAAQYSVQALTALLAR
jgi:glycosyltransferase involved in cell wall biosynthesis